MPPHLNWKLFTQRSKLHTITKANVRNIGLSNERNGGLVATGLNFTVENKPYMLNALREVIVSGGTMKSAQMLETSGIGGVELLKPFGIEVLIVNGNVEENLQDHPQLLASFHCMLGPTR